MYTKFAWTLIALLLFIGTAQAQTVNNKNLVVGQAKKYALSDQSGNPIDGTLCSLQSVGAQVTLTKTAAFITITPVAVGTSIGVRWSCQAPAGFTGSATSGPFNVTVTNAPWSVTAVGETEIP
jgi:hypothetical protein